MTSPSIQTYEQLVRRSGLVDEEKLREVMKQLRTEANGSPTTADRLARKLIDAGLITEWQNGKLMKGKHQGFMLGKYKLLSHLSSGGMSSVYLAEHTLMHRKVAIKVLPPARIEDASYLPRFQRECRVMASLDHNNIVRAHDFDVEGRLHYLVLEYIDGCDLQQFVEERGPADFVTAADYIAQAADGLGHAHDLSMVHRDMKPANLMVDSRGIIKVLDLGVARILTGDDESQSLTLAHKEDVLGTADFLAPEQALNSHHVDHRADIYALGCTLYYLLTAGVPFKEENLAKKLMAHQTKQPDPIVQNRADCPAGLVAICERMMAKDLEERYQTMGQVSAALRGWVREYRTERQPARPQVNYANAVASAGTRYSPPPTPADENIGVATAEESSGMGSRTRRPPTNAPVLIPSARSPAGPGQGGRRPTDDPGLEPIVPPSRGPVTRPGANSMNNHHHDGGSPSTIRGEATTNTDTKLPRTEISSNTRAVRRRTSERSSERTRATTGYRRPTPQEDARRHTESQRGMILMVVTLAALLIPTVVGLTLYFGGQPNPTAPQVQQPQQAPPPAPPVEAMPTAPQGP